MRFPNDMFFVLDAIVSAIVRHKKQEILRNWLKSKIGMVVIDVSMYCSRLGNFLLIRTDPKLAVSLAHLVYHSALKIYIGTNYVSDILRSMPMVDTFRNVSLCTNSLLLAKKSIWVKLFSVACFSCSFMIQ